MEQTGQESRWQVAAPDVGLAPHAVSAWLAAQGGESGVTLALDAQALSGAL